MEKVIKKQLRKLRKLVIDFTAIFVILTVLRCVIGREPINLDIIGNSIGGALGVTMGQLLSAHIKKTGVRSDIIRSIIFAVSLIILVCVYALFTILWTIITGRTSNDIIGLILGVVVGFLAALCAMRWVTLYAVWFSAIIQGGMNRIWKRKKKM